MNTDLITCPNCNAKMNLGGECLECGHRDVINYECECDFCMDDNGDDPDPDLDIDGEDEE